MTKQQSVIKLSKPEYYKVNYLIRSQVYLQSNIMILGNIMPGLISLYLYSKHTTILFNITYLERCVQISIEKEIKFCTMQDYTEVK